jgi:hypothetical protein
MCHRDRQLAALFTAEVTALGDFSVAHISTVHVLTQNTRENILFFTKYAIVIT